MKKLGFGKEVEAVEHGFCPICNNPVSITDFKDDLSKKEYKISGLCFHCQNEMFD